MDAMELLRDELRRSLHGPAWHGPALLEALDHVTTAEACTPAIAGVHTVAELALHALAWIEEVTRRVRGAPPALPARGDWPAVARLDEPAWRRIRRDIARAGADLDRELSQFPLDRLTEPVGGSDPDPALGNGVSFAVMLHGLAQHNAYHGGQVSLLRRASRPGSVAGVPAPSAS